MDSYQLHRDLMSFVILRNNRIDWQGKFELTWSGFGFFAENCEGERFTLTSSGILFWRKLKLLKNGTELDLFKVTESSNYPVSLKRGADFYIDGKNIFSITNHREDSKYGQFLASWETDAAQYKETIYTLILLAVQNRAGAVAGVS